VKSAPLWPGIAILANTALHRTKHVRAKLYPLKPDFVCPSSS